MYERASAMRGPRPPGSEAALVAAGPGRVVADAVVLARIEQALMRTRIGRMPPLPAWRCIQLGCGSAT